MAVNEPEVQPSFSIVDPRMTVEAMRDSGYKSTTHALAELIDNAIESGATAIEIFGVSRRDDSTGRFTLKELAVLDNGEGMDGNHASGKPPLRSRNSPATTRYRPFRPRPSQLVDVAGKACRRLVVANGRHQRPSHLVVDRRGGGWRQRDSPTRIVLHPPGVPGCGPSRIRGLRHARGVDRPRSRRMETGCRRRSSTRRPCLDGYTGAFLRSRPSDSMPATESR